MKKVKLLLISLVATATISVGAVGLGSTKAYADTLSEVPGSVQSQQAQQVTAKEAQNIQQQPPVQQFSKSSISSNFYIYNIPGVQRIQYGTSGQGRPLYYYKIGNGPNTLFANFAIHGYEDSWSQDGYQLTKIAHQLIEKFNTKNQNSGLNGWTVIIVPCANPDGILDGWTNNGPGRTQVSKRIDLNRDFPTFFKPYYDARNYTGPEPLGAPEAKDLANLVAKISRQSRNMVVLDTHGWLDMTIGDPQIGKYFINNLGLSHNAGYIPTGHGYFISYGHAEGAEVSLVELPWTTSASQVDSRNYVGKMYNAMNQVMQDGTGFTYMNKTGVVTGTSSLNVRSGATTIGYKLGTLSGGQQVHIVGKINGWYKIYDPSIGYAYVSGDYITINGDGGSLPSTGGTNQNGWQQSNGNWYYYNNGSLATGWDQISGTWYYFNSNGVMQTGWVNDNGTWYYMNSNGSMATGWIQSNNTWYYMNSNGSMATGWQQIDNSWFYLDPSGAMQTGWQLDKGTWYYLNSNGAMATGWVNDNGTWYYMNSNGSMATGWIQLNGSWYYLNSNGAMVTDWQQIGQYEYYFTPSGVMQTGWQNDGSNWYYLNDNGSMQVNGWVNYKDNWYYMGESGAMQTGWQQINNKWYYFDNNGIMASNTTINGNQVDGTGALVGGGSPKTQA